jgi:hypothetical protein
MDRRGFIVTTGAVLVAGCLSGSAAEQTPTPETPSEAADPTPTASQNTDPGQSPPAATTSTSTSHKTPPSRELTEVTVSEIETSDFSVQTQIERAAITPDQTARFALTITSHLQETEFGFSNCIPFTCVTESDPGAALTPVRRMVWAIQSNANRTPNPIHVGSCPRSNACRTRCSERKNPQRRRIAHETLGTLGRSQRCLLHRTRNLRREGSNRDRYQS